MRVRIAATVETPTPVERIRDALLDFSEKRLETWSTTLDPSSYQVHEIGDTWAEVTEGNRIPKLWARERYDWSTPDTITWTTQDSDFCEPGSHISMRLTERAAGGSRVEVVWDRTAVGVKGHPWLLPPRLGGSRMLAWATRHALKTIDRA